MTMDTEMLDEMLQVAVMPTTSSFLEFLAMHAEPNAPLLQWGYYPGARGEVLTEEMAVRVPGSEAWIGQCVFDANGLIERFVSKTINGDYSERMRVNYDEWCYGHIGTGIETAVQLPGTAIFRQNAQGEFEDIAFLYRKMGESPLDWEIIVCNDVKSGLCVQKLDNRWTHWGLMSMVMRYNVPSAYTEKEPVLAPGEAYAYVLSSVLNCRGGADRHLITSVPHGTKLKLTGRTDENWTECVLGDGTVGWLFSRFLVKHNF